MKTVVRLAREGKMKDVRGQALAAAPQGTDLDTLLALIQALIPLGLQAFAEVMQAEVTQLAGPRYGRAGGQPGLVRWGRQRGSIFLADQKVPVAVQRVRDHSQGRRSRCRATSGSRRRGPQTAGSSARSSSA